MAAPSQTTESESKRHRCVPSAACPPSKVEEIIAMLWTILWGILWANDAHPFALWFVGIKAVLDHLTAIQFAIRELRGHNAESIHPDTKP